MDRASLVRSLGASLQDAATRLDGASDLERMLDVAALDMGRVRPRTVRGSIEVTVDVDAYAAPADLLRMSTSLWGLSQKRSYRPWEPGWPGILPTLSVAETASGRQIVLTPAPTAEQIAIAGSTCQFFYEAGHVIGDDAADTTVQPGDGALLLLRAQAEAMNELAMRGSAKPVRLRDGQTQGARNGTPAGLYAQLMRQFEAQAR